MEVPRTLGEPIGRSGSSIQQPTGKLQICLVLLALLGILLLWSQLLTTEQLFWLLISSGLIICPFGIWLSSIFLNFCLPSGASAGIWRSYLVIYGSFYAWRSIAATAAEKPRFSAAISSYRVTGIIGTGATETNIFHHTRYLLSTLFVAYGMKSLTRITFTLPLPPESS